MDSPICGACDLAAQIENARLKIQIERLKQRLKVAKVIAETIKRRSQEQMDGGNLQRARWAYIRGLHDSAAKVSRAL